MSIPVWVPGAVSAGGLDAVPDLERIESAFVTLGEQYGRSVVSVRSLRRLSTIHGGNPHDDVDDTVFYKTEDRLVPAAGSGVLIRAGGVIITNEHVVQGAERIEVVLHDGRQFVATSVRTDPRSDLAVVTIEADKLTVAKLGDLARVRRGQWAIAMGNPYGFSRDGQAAMSYGIVSAIGRALPELDRSEKRYYGNLIQTDADINPGNSGGPLFNLYGEVIGINTAISTRSGSSDGVGFAVPISRRTRAVIDKLIVGEKVEYGFLGVRVDTLKGHDGRAKTGAYVTDVLAATPAAGAKLRKGDCIVALDGVPIDSGDHLVRLVGATPIGRPVTVKYIRLGRTRLSEIALRKRAIVPPPQEVRLVYRWRGMEVGCVDEARRKRFDLPDGAYGLVITQIEPNSPAEKAGLRRGQIIERIGPNTVSGLDELRETARSVSGAVVVQAGGTQATLVSSKQADRR